MKWLQLVDQNSEIPDIDVDGGAYLYGLQPIAKGATTQTPSKSSAVDEEVTFDLHSPPHPKRKGKNIPSALIPSKKIILHKWVHYKFPNKGLLITDAGKEKYEIFCGGFLLFYDDVVRNAVVDHTIYLKWVEKNNAVHKNPEDIFYSSVTIYIDPAPDRKNKNKYGKIDTLDEIPHILPSYGDTVDPPPPPPPPPPRF